jgi:alkyl sulfatase BDS1-like metallo-beta-lactamase superfamily hydrolase
MTIEEFERQEMRDKRERAYVLAAKGLTWRQIAERMGVPDYLAQKWTQRGRKRCR